MLDFEARRLAEARLRKHRLRIQKGIFYIKTGLTKRSELSTILIHAP
jgi:hypothetical protein